VDVVAVDAAGGAVTDLTAADFEVVQGGAPRRITHFNWFDTVLHSGVTRGVDLPALELPPDEIRRNVVAVVDDLGLSPAGIDAVREQLRAFVANGMSSGDRMAIVRASGGSATLQQLTGDTRTLGAAIDRIGYRGGGTGEALPGGASWLALSYVLDGLSDFAGRKVVVVFSERPEQAGAGGGVVAGALRAAHLAMAAVYTVDPLARGGGTSLPSAMFALARDTGGRSGESFANVLRSERGYYAIGFAPAEVPPDATGRALQAPATVSVRRPGVVLRSRAGYVGYVPRPDVPVPAVHGELLGAARRSPFAGAGLDTRLTVIASDNSAQNVTVDVVVHFDPHGLALIHDAEDKYRGKVYLWVKSYRDDGVSPPALERGYDLALTPTEYREGLANGLRFKGQLKLPGRGGAWQIRAVVADVASDSMGTAAQSIEVPNLAPGGLALSGLAFRGGSPEPDARADDPREDLDVRVFAAGHTSYYFVTAFGALAGPDKQPSLEAVARIYAGGRLVVDGKAEPLTLVGVQAPRTQLRGLIRLDPKMAPGDYVLEVTIRDRLAPQGPARTATQFVDFQVRQ